MNDNLNEEQKQALLYLKTGKNAFITGGAGTGKSYLISEFINQYDNTCELDLAVTSTTGISALLLKNGKTIHSWAGIKLGTGDLYSLVSKNKAATERWLNVKTLIIDEISMLNINLFEKLNNLACRIRNNTDPFGGIQIILVGDFCQLPVVKGNNMFVFESVIWDLCNFKIFNFTKIIRQSNLKFSSILQKIRLGNIDDDCKEILNNCIISKGHKIQNINGIKPTILFSTNKDVDSYNNNKLEKLIQNNKEYRTFKPDFNVAFTKLNLQQLINLKKYLLNDYEKLTLSINSQVMLTKNINVASGLANGSRGVVIGFDKDKHNFPIVRFTNGIEEVITLYTSKYIDENNKIIIKYLPLKLAWATTIHKCQGATLDFVVIDLSYIFEYGQAYVALSRARSLDGLFIYANKKEINNTINYDCIDCHPKAKLFYESLNHI